MTQYGFFFDSTRCTGCRTCEMACKDYKDLSATIAFRKVYDYEGGAWSDVGDGTFTSDAFAYHVSLGCQHCAMPACMAKCPQGAIEKDTKTGLRGRIVFVFHRFRPKAALCHGASFTTIRAAPGAEPAS